MKNIGALAQGFFLAFVCSVGVFFAACGMDSVIYVDAPTNTANYPTYSSADETTHYFDFYTKEMTSSEETEASASYLGTGVYYKIYNNYSTLLSQRSAITSVNTSSSGSAAATKMISTYTFQPLGTNYNMSRAVFVKSTNSEKRVRFRLKNVKGTSVSSYSSETLALLSLNYAANLYDGRTTSGNETSYICTLSESGEVWTYSDGTTLDLTTAYPSEFIFPYRYDYAHSFDFFDDDDSDDSEQIDIEPVEGDLDYYYSSTSSETGTYYVQLFAVSIARDSSYTLSYSAVLDLGSVPIKK